MCAVCYSSEYKSIRVFSVVGVRIALILEYKSISVVGVRVLGSRCDRM